MAAPAFDTLKFQQKLSQVFDMRTSTVMAEAFAEATENFASKDDLSVLGAKLDAKIETTATTVRQEIKLESANLRADVASLRAELNDKLRMQTFTLLGGLGVILALVAGASKLFH